MAMKAMPLPDRSLSAKENQFAKPSFEAPGGVSPAEVDPNLLRLLAERKRRQGLSGPQTTPGMQPPQQEQGFKVQGAPIDPRIRAAMLLRDKMRARYQQQTAPAYGDVVPRKV